MNLYERINSLKSFTTGKTARLNEGIFKKDGEVKEVKITYFNFEGMEDTINIPSDLILRFNVYRYIENKFYGYLYFQPSNNKDTMINVEEMLEIGLIQFTAITNIKNINYDVLWSSKFEKNKDGSYIVLFVGNEEEYI